jgi:hypothetical protein
MVRGESPRSCDPTHRLSSRNAVSSSRSSAVVVLPPLGFLTFCHVYRWLENPVVQRSRRGCYASGPQPSLAFYYWDESSCCRLILLRRTPCRPRRWLTSCREGAPVVPPLEGLHSALGTEVTGGVVRLQRQEFSAGSRGISERAITSKWKLSSLRIRCRTKPADLHRNGGKRDHLR